MQSTQPARVIGRTAAIGIALLALSAGAVQAADLKVAATAKPDWNGVWVIAGSDLDIQDGTSLENGGRVDPSKPPVVRSWRTIPKLKGAYLEKYKVTVKSMAEGIPAGGDIDSCKPQGMPRFWSGPDAFEFIQTPKQMNFYQEWNEQTRRIYLDGRKHPADWDPSPNGHSIGHWEGDVMVIDTVGIRPDTLVSYNGVATHSDALKISERIRSIGPNKLEVQMTSVDPNAFEEPWVVKIVYNRHPEMEVLPYDCRQNLRDPGGLSAGAVHK